MARPKKPPQKYASADSKLDPAQFRALNAQFYKGFHEDLVTTRLGMLCLLHNTPNVIEGLLSDGVAWGEVTMKREPEDGDLEILKRNAELELVVLRQHTAEILFRLFWVHGHQEKCPWLALARFRNPGDLKSAVDKYRSGQLWADEDSRHVFHAKAVWGSQAVDRTGAIKPELAPSVETVARWIDVAAMTVQDAPLYNAYKHGLAVVASEAFSLSIGAPEGFPAVNMEAASGFMYINRATDETARRYRWEVVRDPVDFNVAAGEIAAFSTLLRSILKAGSLDRGVTEPPVAVPVFNADLTPAKVRGITSSPGVTVTRFADSLAYFK